MMERVFVYPGQGSQAPGMGKDFIFPGSLAEKIWEEANDILGYDLKEKVLNGSPGELNCTEITQPAVYITEIIIYRELIAAGIRPSATAGHSLGEYAAVVSSGALSWQEGLRLVKFRSELFEKTAAENPGGMLAVIGLEEESLAAVLEEAGGAAEIVNYNSPGQLVVSAAKTLIDNLKDDIGRAGAKMVVPLKVSGGFHSSLMDGAVRPMEEKLETIDFSDPEIKFYANVTGGGVSSGNEIKKLLARQVNSPVRWTDTVNNIITDFSSPLFIESGPGKVLRGLIKRINRRTKTSGVSSPEDIRKLKEEKAG